MGEAHAAERERTFERLDELWGRSLPELPLAGRHYAMFSDTHLGNGSAADDFRRNKAVLADALEYYDKEGYELILLGDIEELWQFEMPEIASRYDASVYQQMRAFGPRLHRVFGNHDIDWGSPVDPVIPGPPVSRGAPEGLKITNLAGEPSILLVHGHQGTADSDKESWFSRFVVRGLWRFAEPAVRWIGLHRNPSETKARGLTKEFERIRYAWAESRHVLLICGHTHRAIFASTARAELLRQEIAALDAKIASDPESPEAKRDRTRIEELSRELRDEQKKGRDIGALSTAAKPKPCYFNTGCGVYSDGMTAIELDENDIRLVKWRMSDQGRCQREELQSDNTQGILAEV